MGVSFFLTLHWSCLYIDGFILSPNCRPFIFIPSHKVSGLHTHVANWIHSYLNLNSLSSLSLSHIGISPKDLHFYKIRLFTHMSCLLCDFTVYGPFDIELYLLRKTFVSTDIAFSGWYDHIKFLSSHSIAKILTCLLACSAWFWTKNCSLHFLPLIDMWFHYIQLTLYSQQTVQPP